MNRCCAQRPYVAPSNGVEIVRVQKWTARGYQKRVKIHDFKEDDNIFVVYPCHGFVDDELLIPLTKVGALYPQVIHLCAHWKKKVSNFVLIRVLLMFALWALEEVTAL